MVYQHPGCNIGARDLWVYLQSQCVGGVSIGTNIAILLLLLLQIYKYRWYNNNNNIIFFIIIIVVDVPGTD